jgi:uncharacterized protein (TIGR03083 family)
METADELAALRREGDALLAAAGRAPLDARVEACPAWSVADLLWHIGEVHHFWATVVEHRLTDPAEAEQYKPPRPPDAELHAFASAQLDHLERVLAAADPAASLWTWASVKNAGFVQRRMAQETLVHRWDAEAAAGSASPLDRELAVDGIDEFLDLFAPYRDKASPDLAGTVHLHATDGEGEWHIAQDGDALVVRRRHEKGDAAVRGIASDLLLWLWGRGSLDRLDVLGDRAAAERLAAWTNTE